MAPSRVWNSTGRPAWRWPIWNRPSGVADCEMRGLRAVVAPLPKPGTEMGRLERHGDGCQLRFEGGYASWLDSPACFQPGQQFRVGSLALLAVTGPAQKLQVVWADLFRPSTRARCDPP